MKAKFGIFLFIAFISLADSARAQERIEFYKGIREQAMGGAAIGVVDDETALLLNPAALGKLREAYVTIANPVVEMGSNDDQIAGGSANLTKMTDPQKALTQCNANPGERLHGMAEMLPSIVFPNFGIGVIGRWSEDAEVNTAKTAYDYEYLEDFGVATGVNFRMWDGIIKIGANARLVDRTQAYQTALSPTTTGLTLSQIETEGVGLGSDAGMIFTLPVAWLPSLSAVVRDIGGTSFTLRGGLGGNSATGSQYVAAGTNPNYVPQTLNGAFTIAPILGNHVHSLWTVEYDDALNAYKDTVPTRNYHGGMELNFYDMLFLRAGYNQGYWSAGLEFAVSTYEIQFSSYGEEVGTKSTLQEDRRYMASFSLRF